MTLDSTDNLKLEEQVSRLQGQMRCSLSTGHKISLLDIEYDGEDGEILRYKFGCVYCQACYYKGVNNLTEGEKCMRDNCKQRGE